MEDKPIKCFQHCARATNILCFSVPQICPLCREDVTLTPCRIPPYCITSPFVAAGDTQCCLVIKPTVGNFLRDFGNSSNLHVGLTDSKGVVHEFDENGLTIGGSNWCQCVSVKLIQVTQEIVQQWDRGLQEFVLSSAWSKERYHEDRNNCYDFVIEFLRHLGLDRLYPCLSDRLVFCRELILPRTHKAGQYISLYREILKKGFVCQKVNDT